MPKSHWGRRRGMIAGTLGAFLFVSGCSLLTQKEATPEPPPPSSSSSAPSSRAPASSAPTTDTPPDTTGDEPAPADSPLITDLRLCGLDSYDSQANICRRATPQSRGSDLHCSATVEVGQADGFTVSFYRDGLLAYETDVDFPKEMQGTTVPIYGKFGAGQLDLPGGEWLCEIALSTGDRETGRMSMTGPAAGLSQAMACDSAAVYEQGSTKHCRANAAVVERNASRISCSALLAYPGESEIEMQVEWKTAKSSGERSLGTNQSPFGVLVYHASFNPQFLDGKNEFGPGDYQCRYYIDGDEVANHRFRVG